MFIAVTGVVVGLEQAAHLNYYQFYRRLSVECSPTVHDRRVGHSEGLDYGYFSSDSDFTNALDVRFNGYCRIPYIPQTFIKRVPRMEKVDLFSNEIEIVKREDFRENRELRVLDVQHNLITEIPEYLFSYTPKIEEAYFQYNDIFRIDGNAFALGVQNLKKIDLSYNRIKKLDPNLFLNATTLTHIDISHNLLELFKPTLSNLTKLRSLHLNNNRIVRMSCNIFPNRIVNELLIDFSSNDVQEVKMKCGANHTRYGPNRVYLNIAGNLMDNVVFITQHTNDGWKKNLSALNVGVMCSMLSIYYYITGY